MNIDKILEILNDIQRNILICFIIQLPLCYTFLYMFSDFFSQQDFVNRIIFSASFDISILFVSTFCLLSVSVILNRFDTESLIYLFTGGSIHSFTLSILRKMDNYNDTISCAIIYYVCWVLGILIFSFFIRFMENKKNKNTPTNKP